MNLEPQSYEEYQEELKAEQSDMSYDEVKEQMRRQSKHILELDNLPPVTHIWVDRGAVMSCENAGHPNHHAWKRT